MVFHSTLHYFKFFKGYLPQILLGPFLNTLTQMTSPNVSPAVEKILYWSKIILAVINIHYEVFPGSKVSGLHNLTKL